MFIRFSFEFWRTIWHMRSVNLALFALIVINSWAISYVEKLPFGDALYFAFITGLTIGYGDIVVKTPVGHITKEKAKEISGLADHEFEKAYDSASNIADKVMQHEGEKMDKFLEHFAKEIEQYMEHFGGKLFK